jgi:hypothetical protein
MPRITRQKIESVLQRMSELLLLPELWLTDWDCYVEFATPCYGVSSFDHLVSKRDDAGKQNQICYSRR